MYSYLIFKKIIKITKYIIYRVILSEANGDWGLGIGDWAQSPIPNPQSPIPNPQNILIF